VCWATQAQTAVALTCTVLRLNEFCRRFGVAAPVGGLWQRRRPCSLAFAWVRAERSHSRVTAVGSHLTKVGETRFSMLLSGYLSRGAPVLKCGHSVVGFLVAGRCSQRPLTSPSVFLDAFRERRLIKNAVGQTLCHSEWRHWECDPGHSRSGDRCARISGRSACARPEAVL